jgi:hypothetical protein
VEETHATRSAKEDTQLRILPRAFSRTFSQQAGDGRARARARAAQARQQCAVDGGRLGRAAGHAAAQARQRGVGRRLVQLRSVQAQARRRRVRGAAPVQQLGQRHGVRLQARRAGG